MLPPGCARFSAEGGLFLPMLPSLLQICYGGSLADSVPSALSGWRCRRRITFDNSASSTNLTNFPVGIVLTSGTNMEYNEAASGGADLRFVDPDGTVLNHEIERWDTTGSSVAWVRVPQIDATSRSDYVTMYYGNAGAADGQNRTGVWSQNYVNVNHMDGSLLDSTASGNNGTNAGTTDAEGRLGRGRAYDGTAANVSHANAGFSSVAGTVLVWARPTAAPVVGAQVYAFSHRNGGTNSRAYLLLSNNAGSYDFRIGIGDQFNNANTQTGDVFTLGQWHLLALTWSGGATATYFNGRATTTATGAFAWAGGVNTVFHSGQYTGGGELWIGTLDEVRVSDVARSADWIRAQYLSMTGSLVSYSAAERL